MEFDNVAGRNKRCMSNLVSLLNLGDVGNKNTAPDDCKRWVVASAKVFDRSVVPLSRRMVRAPEFLTNIRRLPKPGIIVQTKLKEVSSLVFEDVRTWGGRRARVNWASASWVQRVHSTSRETVAAEISCGPPCFTMARGLWPSFSASRGTAVHRLWTRCVGDVQGVA